MIILGIDLGFKGALAIYDREREADFTHLYDMPTVKKGAKPFYDIPTIISITRYHNPKLACVEDVWSRPTDGHTGAFRFGEGKGIFEGVLTALDIEQQWVSPQKWKRFYDLLGKDKDASRAKALELYPCEAFARKENHGRAEAFLIALYGSTLVE